MSRSSSVFSHFLNLCFFFISSPSPQRLLAVSSSSPSLAHARCTCPVVPHLFARFRYVFPSNRSCAAAAGYRVATPGKGVCMRNGFFPLHFRCCCSVSPSDVAPASEGAGNTSGSVRKRVVSGVQPAGSIHLGNYLGVIKNWSALQITLPYETQQLAKATRDTTAIYLACGVDTSKAAVFVQSHVHAHVELMWLLSSDTPIGWLNRMIQFKEKSRKAGDENVGVALLTYPVLMASDILLYQSDFDPVGEDQKQHLELTREITKCVNYLYGRRKWMKLGGRGGMIFKVPEPRIPPAGARIMSLTDGLSKMLKSAPSDQSRINLLDSKDVIAGKIKRCKTDSFSGLEFDNPDRPECNNLLCIYQLVSGKTKAEVAQECQNMIWGTFKPLITDALIDHLHPIQVGYEEIMSDSTYLDGILAEGTLNASEIADATLNNTKRRDFYGDESIATYNI